MVLKDIWTNFRIVYSDPIILKRSLSYGIGMTSYILVFTYEINTLIKRLFLRLYKYFYENLIFSGTINDKVRVISYQYTLFHFTQHNKPYKL